MAPYDPFSKSKISRGWRGLWVGASAGALLGGALGFLGGLGTFPFPRLTAFTAFGPLTSTLVGAAAGAALFGLIGVLYGMVGQGQADGMEQPQPEQTTEGTMRLKEEQLDITTERERLNDVEIHREVVEELQTVTVPVQKESLVIETKRAAGSEEGQQLETIRIPLREERIEVTKRPLIRNEVKVYKREYETGETVEATLKKEEARLEIQGQPIIREEDPDPVRHPSS